MAGNNDFDMNFVADTDGDAAMDAANNPQPTEIKGVVAATIPVPEGKVLVDEADLNELKSFMKTSKQQSAFVNTMNALGAEYPDFNQAALMDALANLHKIDPKKAEAYGQSKETLEAFWLKECAPKLVQNDVVGTGVSKGADAESFEELQAKAKGGDKIAKQKLLALSKA